MGKEKNNHEFALIAIVAVVAIVGLVMMFSQNTGKNYAKTEYNAGYIDNEAGQAVYYGDGKVCCFDEEETGKCDSKIATTNCVNGGGECKDKCTASSK